VGGILAAASPGGGTSSSRLVGDSPEDAVASADTTWLSAISIPDLRTIEVIISCKSM
jgi:hypothetical protein